MSDLEIIPSILTNDLDEAEDLLSQSEGVVSRVQIDIIDGEFADNKTIDPSFLANTMFDLDFDFHLMVKEPLSWVQKCINANADRIIGQIEMMESQEEFVEKVLENSIKVGLAVDLETPVSDILPEMLPKLDVVLLMSVPAGFGGQAFDDKVLSKIKMLAKEREDNGFSYKICIDGGVNNSNVSEVKKAGADEVSIGRLLFRGDVASNIRSLNNES